MQQELEPFWFYFFCIIYQLRVHLGPVHQFLTFLKLSGYSGGQKKLCFKNIFDILSLKYFMFIILYLKMWIFEVKGIFVIGACMYYFILTKSLLDFLVGWRLSDACREGVPVLFWSFCVSSFAHKDVVGTFWSDEFSWISFSANSLLAGA